MTLGDKIEYLWNAAYEEALGVSHADPSDYASRKVAHLNAELRRVERAQLYAGTGHPKVGSRAGRRQAAAR